MERMMGMSAMKTLMADLAPMMQGNVPYDGIAVQEAAFALQGHAGETLTGLFPQDDIPKASYAKREIWTDWERFAALSEELRLYSEGLSIAAANGLDAPVPAPVVATNNATAMPGMDHTAMQMPAEPEGFTVSELMGITSRAAVSPGTIAGAATETRPPGVDFAAMAADDVFERISQTCASCHAQFRRGN
ncbi:cytochrome c [Cypionkella psychrotolerans]|uniref:cytochrome c n=1 Tax=Cypionkella psychrotolerans TaxID=1678131 RepID=UPI00138ED085|nr:cytochrome c [Cypionkella psychrotolerans]